MGGMWRSLDVHARGLGTMSRAYWDVRIGNNAESGGMVHDALGNKNSMETKARG